MTMSPARTTIGDHAHQDGTGAGSGPIRGAGGVPSFGVGVTVLLRAVAAMPEAMGAEGMGCGEPRPQYPHLIYPTGYAESIG
jgi:hypothetical protein